jgi:AraC-like DNA-binding protein
MLSKYGHRGMISQSDVPKVNANLVTSIGYLRSLDLDGIVITCRRVHLGKGIYPAGKKVSVHRHDDLQIEYALAGSFVFADSKSEVRLSAGHCLVVPPGLPHRWSCVRQGMLLGAELAVAGPSAQGFLESLRQALKNSILRIEDERIALWAGQMLDVALQPVPYAWRRAMIGSLLHLWFAQILKMTMPIEPWRQAVPYTKQTAGDRSRLLVRQALDFMQANYGMTIGLKDIADQLGITPRHLTRLFRQYEQKSVNTNLLDIRLRRARELLTSPAGHSVKEVAYRCGFASPSHFTQCFRKGFGRLPSQVADASSTAGNGAEAAMR